MKIGLKYLEKGHIYKVIPDDAYGIYEDDEFNTYLETLTAGTELFVIGEACFWHDPSDEREWYRVHVLGVHEELEGWISLESYLADIPAENDFEEILPP